MENLLTHLKYLQTDYLNYVIKERGMFSKVNEIIYDYCNKHETAIVSDVDLLLDTPVTGDKIIVYSFDLETDAKNITDLLYKKLNDKFTNYNLVSKDQATIKYNFRKVCDIYSFGLDKISVKLLTPVKKELIEILPPEIEIINIYNDLYSLENDNYDELLHMEEKLISLIDLRISDNVFGGKPEERSVAYYKKIILNKIVKDTDNILVGESVLLINDKQFTPRSNIRLITKNITAFIKKLKHLLGDVFVYKKINIKIPKDPLIEIYYIYININGKKFKILTLYNESKFKLIPVSKMYNYNIADKWVCLKFLFIEFWIIRILYYNDKISKQTYSYFTTHTLTLINDFRKLKKTKNIYIGSYIDSQIYNKIKNLNLQSPYYPYSK